MPRIERPPAPRWTRLGLTLSCAAILLAAAPASAQAEPSLPPIGADGVVKPGANPFGGLVYPDDEARLSNEVSITRWANAVTRSFVRTRPSATARPVTRLRAVSGTLAPEIYGVLSARVDSHRRIWLRVRVPGRPNGRVGWAPASAFGSLHLTRLRLVVRRAAQRATLYRSGRRIWQARVGVGKASTPTPSGHFFVDRIEGAVFGPAYGPHVLFTSAYSSLPGWPGGGAVGIHGTNQPQLVPGRPSHGCIRIRNGDVTRLARRAEVGTPLRIL
jgi:lipoprotein-anchoring transpeptidase ErfK/SrfK